MCDIIIISCVGRGDETLDVLVYGLSKLQYPGYDSAGVALGGHEAADGAEPEAALRTAVDRLEGSYAVAGTDAVFVARNDSPLVLGLDDDATYLASAVSAFRDYTDKKVYLADGEFARLDREGWMVH
ncbi:hypothetical protein [Halomicrobium mukohataei]